ncbi:FAD-dependent oxidoreductase [Microbacterium sp. DT81.1]|uniref:FAD-dependent oxidoreductase n=1 Tax=Microbacterium sp. DT81.1 TaxID=3393413 RepID=UPI003CF5AB17
MSRPLHVSAREHCENLHIGRGVIHSATLALGTVYKGEVGNGVRVRIAIVGGGAAGLASAWLLEGQHDITLFEKDDRPGGHAHTVEVEVDAQRVAVDAGFQFFGRGPAYATFNRLLDLLGVQRESYPATITLFGRDPRRPGRRRALPMPPFRGGRPVWASFTPRALCDLIRFRIFLARVPAFLERHDTTVTIEQYLEDHRVSRRFAEEVVNPLLLAFWCVEPAEFRRFAAYNALYYLGANAPKGLSPPRQSQIRGGLAVYVDALVRDLRATELHLGTAVRRVEREGGGYAVEDARGIRHRFDQVIVATNAQQALPLLEAVPGLEPMRRQLGRFEYFDTAIAVHGDRRLMPPDESDWSVVNARWDGEHSALTIWDPARGLPVFKSWVTFDERMPQPIYALARYEHGKVTPDYFDAQRRLCELQGREGVWLAGLYTHDADSHESAIRSAVTVAQRLAPDSVRLRRLLA